MDKQRILISWVAYTYDFLKEDLNKVNPNGTHGTLYKNSFNYDKHLLLCAADERMRDTKFDFLVSHLRSVYGKMTIPMYLGVQDIIDISEIKDLVYPILMDYKEEIVEIFISPGTPAMQTAWYLLAMEFKNVSLFQMRPVKYCKSDETQRVPVKVISSSITGGLEILEKRKRKIKNDPNLCQTNTINKTFQEAERVAKTNNATTIIFGETGTGKELIAKHIHKNSRRKNYPFKAINCAALGDDLLESRLFGHKKGSFTGAESTKGIFQEADKGTIFLDEIGDITPKLQQTLLRVLQEREVAPIGTFESIKINVRVIVATHKDLWEQVELGEFRADLYYRLMVADITTVPFIALPPKEKQELINFFLLKKKNLFEKEEILTLSKDVKKCLLQYAFPGNIREVEHLIERFYIYCSGIVTLKDVPERIRHPEGSSASLKASDVENNHIKKVLSMFSGNISKASKVLGVSGNKVRGRIEKFNWKF